VGNTVQKHFGGEHCPETFWWGTLSRNIHFGGEHCPEIYILKTEQGKKDCPEIHVEEGSDEWKGLE
jgi:hypothetical protein